MHNFVKTITEWMLKKEEEMARECAIPMKEVNKQIDKVEEEKIKLTRKYNDSMALLNEVSEKLEKIKNIEILKCQKK
ncbi:hypothetical protein JHD47_08805 [Sulfurimonas sp. SAG-AH-194-L11]|nr:hypothetical protein [Sulfurimonas sp. SAG-AH-194-L11]MDF1877912.1 hypothetical protein [Sulfurimonas sp. SAG-AH-194-L11]